MENKVKPTYYDGTKLLSMLDINGEKPEVFICTTNRTGGKTTYFSRLMLNRWIQKHEKFMLIYRFKNELADCAQKFFKDIGCLFFQGHEFKSEKRADGVYNELFYDGISCGYAVALNAADSIKKYSHLFSDVCNMFMDEFQSETNHYCSDEVKKLFSVHTSVARGQGEQVRYVPVYLIGNPVTILNPYYVALGISERITDKVKFLKGDGFVLEQGYVDSAANAQKQSAFNRAFKNCDYAEYASEAVYLNDNYAFIEKLSGKSKYLATVRYNGKDFAIRQYMNLGIIYCDNHADNSFPLKISVTTDDHNINYVMLRSNDIFIFSMRYYFTKGAFRFKDLSCKEAIVKMLSF